MPVDLSAEINLDNKSITAAADKYLTHFVDNLMQMLSGLNDGDREKWVEKVHKHFSETFPQHGVMVIHKGQDQINAPEDSYKHFHLEFRKTFGTEGFEVYVIKKGSGLVISNTGDGGFINWRFSGQKNRDGGAVTF
ncbi:hypothetical protein MRB56_12645 [Halomonas cupida]|uniref:hypothetical protein n=1 Tax=Halomonas cupida TaxID=44933 RepID=UPI0039B40CED